MKRIIRAALIGTASIGIAVGVALPSQAWDFHPGGCQTMGDRVICQIR